MLPFALIGCRSACDASTSACPPRLIATQPQALGSSGGGGGGGAVIGAVVGVLAAVALLYAACRYRSRKAPTEPSNGKLTTRIAVPSVRSEHVSVQVVPPTPEAVTVAPNSCSVSVDAVAATVATPTPAANVPAVPAAGAVGSTQRAGVISPQHEALLQAAVAREDYDEAARLKKAIEAAKKVDTPAPAAPAAAPASVEGPVAPAYVPPFETDVAPPPDRV